MNLWILEEKLFFVYVSTRLVMSRQTVCNITGYLRWLQSQPLFVCAPFTISIYKTLSHRHPHYQFQQTIQNLFKTRNELHFIQMNIIQIAIHHPNLNVLVKHKRITQFYISISSCAIRINNHPQHLSLSSTAERG